MNLFIQRNCAALMTLLLLVLGLAPQPVKAEEHVVPLSDLQREMRSTADARTSNLSDIRRVLSLPAAQDALQKAKINQDQALKAIATLDDQELSRLADRARAAEQDVQGGLIVGILALIGLIVVIIIVVSLVR